MAKIRFWGVRGSIPTPGPTTLRYGGNTSCVELRHRDKLFILDAGSGLRLLGQQLLRESGPVKASIVISHMHWDHIQGIPFFTPAYIPDNEFVFYGAEDSERDLNTIIADQMDPTYFPIELGDMASQITFKRLYEGTYMIDETRMDTIYLNHPGNALGYKFYLDDKIIVYISDNEPFVDPATIESDDDLIGENGNEKLIDFIRDADLLIHDAQYTPDEYKNKQTWGHSPYDYTTQIALEANVKHLILYHHDPLHSDEQIDEILEKSKELVKQNNKRLHIDAASEGRIIEF